jgi:hypothetical protein
MSPLSVPLGCLREPFFRMPEEPHKSGTGRFLEHLRRA